MLARTFLGASVVAAALMASSAAFATPISNVAGIGVPVGNDVFTESEYETNAATSAFQGIGIVNLISNGGSTFSYGNGAGNPPPYLYSEFSGFTFDQQIGNDFYFKGGQLSYYQFSTNQAAALTSASTASAAVAMVKSGSLWLSLVPVALNAAGDTLDIHVPSGNLSNAANSSAYSILDTVAGVGAGPANSVFSTCTIADSNAAGVGCSLGLADFNFNGGAQNNPDTTSAFAVVGTGSVTSFSVPEPVTLSLFGAGLIGAGFSRRRKAKKA